MSDEKPRVPSVVDGVIMSTSVSAMQKADGCPRAYRYKYLEKLPDKPPSQGQKTGAEGHKRLEHFLLTGDDILGRSERIGLTRGLIPKPGPDLRVEQAFTGGPVPMTADTIPMVGYMDLVSPRYLSEGLLEITDWKFKKSIDDWACTEEELIDPKAEAGIQMLGYAEWARRNAATFSGAFDRIRLRHVTFQTQGRADAAETVTTVNLSEVKEKWQEIERRVVPDMRAAIAAPHAQDTKKNVDQCDRYGGCPYRNTCLDRMAKIVAGFKKKVAFPPAPDLVTVTPHTKGNTMGMLSNLLAPATPAVPPVTPPAAASSRIVDMPTSTGELYAKDCTQGSVYKVGTEEIAATFLAGVSQAGETRFSFIPLAGGMPLLIEGKTPVKIYVAPPADQPLVVPLDAPKSLGVAAQATPAPSILQNIPQPVSPQTAAAMTEKLTESIASVAPVEAPAEEKKEKVKAKKKEEAPAPAATIEAPAASSSRGFSLYFGCSPVGEPTKTLNSYVEKLDADLRAHGQINSPDLRSTTTSEFGFGKWKGFLAKLAVEQPPEPGHYVVTRGDERVEVVADALISLAALVVMGNGR